MSLRAPRRTKMGRTPTTSSFAKKLKYTRDLSLLARKGVWCYNNQRMGE